ncbi:unnamed protein product [Ranitomeya imitator]|uniref:Uncharacterized protein n=1 Tax=Ranitomeya imitator TaxID=111125 RepID=A0ABN9LHN0_9NEOB|nr:unnamed protein product [Ranitomeya imitator]
MVLYLASSIFPSILTIFPVPAEEKQAQTIMLPPSLTVELATIPDLCKVHRPMFAWTFVISLLQSIRAISTALFISPKLISEQQLADTPGQDCDSETTAFPPTTTGGNPRAEFTTVQSVRGVMTRWARPGQSNNTAARNRKVCAATPWEELGKPPGAGPAKRKKKKAAYVDEDVNGFRAAQEEQLRKVQRSEGRRQRRQQSKKDKMVCFHCRKLGTAWLIAQKP